MKVLHLDSGREMRGGQWQALRLIEGLHARKVECTLLARRGTPLSDKALAKGLDVRPLSWWNVFQLSRSADLVHAHDAHTHTLAALAGKGPLVVARRVAFPIGSRWKYARAQRYAAVSQYVKRVMMEGGVAEERIAVIYDGVPIGAPQGGGDAVLAPATTDPLKGATLASEATLRAGVDLLFSSDLESDLSAAALFLYLTRSEGLGSAVLLAMAAGVPVIASNVGGIPEIIRHGENGWLAENAVEPIADAIRTLLGDRELARRLAASGRQTVQEKFSLDQMVQQTMGLYRQVLAC